jgi:hypothetical protein
LLPSTSAVTIAAPAASISCPALHNAPSANTSRIATSVVAPGSPLERDQTTYAAATNAPSARKPRPSSQGVELRERADHAAEQPVRANVRAPSAAHVLAARAKAALQPDHEAEPGRLLGS